jgi:uncharacterized protein
MAGACAAPRQAQGPACRRLEDGRWHFWHGPIDLVIQAEGSQAAVREAIDVAWQRFSRVLGDLVGELRLLRCDARTLAAQAHAAQGEVASRMLAAVIGPARVFDLFVTPMAAVAGAVAEHIAESFRRPGIERTSVNNGGDIALVFAPGRSWDIGVVADPADGRVGAQLRIDADQGIGGVATSGWHGRSFSLGIADSVTVLAENAAAADCAATLIANHVDLPDHPGIIRRPACEIRDDSDLGAIEVTVAVAELPQPQIERALARGAAFARRCIDSGFARQALLTLQGRSCVVSAENGAQVRMAAHMLGGMT